MTELTIHRMNRNEIDMAVDWAAEEGWNPGLYDANCFYTTDPNGFFIAKLGDEPVAVGSAVNYGSDYAFCGFYIVKPEYRGKGIGMKLTEARLGYVNSRLTGIDGVTNMLEKYARIGYVTAHYNARYAMTGDHQFAIDKHVVDISTLPFDDIVAYDRRYFPANRAEFLKAWTTQPESHAVAYVDRKQVLGYGVARKCRDGYKIGPLFAETTLIAEAIFQALVTKSGNGPYFLDIPVPNRHALSLVKKYNMQEVFKTARMYRNGKPDIELDKVFGITTFELG